MYLQKGEQRTLYFSNRKLLAYRFVPEDKLQQQYSLPWNLQ